MRAFLNKSKAVTRETSKAQSQESLIFDSSTRNFSKIRVFDLLQNFSDFLKICVVCPNFFFKILDKNQLKSISISQYLNESFYFETRFPRPTTTNCPSKVEKKRNYIFFFCSLTESAYKVKSVSFM